VNTRACKKAALGGTFSLFHEGHKHFLRKSLEVADKVLIGISSDELVSKLGKNHPVERYEERAVKVLSFCIKYVTKGQSITIFPLNDKYGPSVIDTKLDCIILSEENKEVVVEVNKLRKIRGLKPLKAIIVNLFRIEGGIKLSSSLIWRNILSKFKGYYSKDIIPTK